MFTTVGENLTSSFAKAFLAGGFLVLIVGCGDGRSPRISVSGQVLIDGEPLPAGNIKFVPEGARPSVGEIDEEGQFTLTCYDGGDGAIPGKHRLEIVSNELEGESSLRWFAPKKYANFLTSGLEVEVYEPTDTLEINLTWSGGKPFVEKMMTGGGRL